MSSERHPIWQIMSNHGYVDEALSRELYRWHQQKVEKVLQTERVSVLSLSNSSKIDRIIALAEKKGYERGRADYALEVTKQIESAWSNQPNTQQEG